MLKLLFPAIAFVRDDLSDSLVSMTKSIQAYQEAQAELMDSFIKLIADAIDAKSPYTGGHCQRVPEVAMLLAKAANAVDDGPFKDFRFDTDEAWREFEIGAWLHDCGKVTTPEYVVDKATKLETIYNRIHGIRTRFEVIWRDIEIEAYEKRFSGENEKQISAWKQEAQQALVDDFAFITECNIGGETTYRGCQKNVPIEDLFSATTPYAAILFSEHCSDNRYKTQAGQSDSQAFDGRCDDLDGCVDLFRCRHAAGGKAHRPFGPFQGDLHGLQNVG